MSERERYTPLLFLHDAIVVCCSIWIGGILFSGEFGWRDGPPRLSFFVMNCILPVAFGVGLSIGCVRSVTSWRRITGILGFATCGLFLALILLSSFDSPLHVYNRN